MKTPQVVSDAADQAADKARDLYAAAADKAQDLAGQAGDKARDLYAQVSDKAQDLYGEAADKAKDLYEQAADRLPEPVKRAGAKTADFYRGLTPTQKLVGGLLLAAGLTYLAVPKKKAKAKRRAKVLSTLLLYVNDRVEGYKRAAADTRDAKQRSFYQDLVGQSQHFAATLNDYLVRKGQTPEKGTTLKGKVYRKLMDAQAAATGHDEKALLAANVHGEAWAVRAYKKALRSGKLKGDIRETVKRQLLQSKQTLKQLKMLAA